MQNILKLALIQSDLYWEDPEKNRQAFLKKINRINEEVDLIILPEMFNTGFTMNASQLAETADGPTLEWMKDLSAKKRCAIAGSLIVSENSSYYNRFIFVDQGEVQSFYNKHKLFTLAREHETYEAGEEEVIITYKGWKIKPQICYDLRFPVWARNTSGYDVLIYVASWPKPRIEAWDTLLKARAIENMSYCIGVNRVGVDEKGHEYNGHSNAFDVLGNSLLQKEPLEGETTIILELDKTHIKNTRKKLPFLEDKDQFKLF